MASFAKLPVETIDRICQFLVRLSTESLRNLCLANKHLNQIGSPWLIHRWDNSQECAEPTTERFVLHLFRHPELRKKVKRLSIGYALELGQSNPSVVGLDNETLAALSQAAASDVKMESEYRNQLCSDIERGSVDALNVLLLAWCTGVNHLSITIPPFSIFDDEHGHVLTFAKQAIVRLLHETPSKDLPFAEVRHLEVHHCHTHNHLFFGAVTSFFHLPKIQSVVISRIHDRATHLEVWSNGTFDPYHGHYARRYAMAIPNVDFIGDGLSTLLHGVGNLKKLTLRPTFDPTQEATDREEIAEALSSMCQDSVEEIDLRTDRRGYLLNPESLKLDYDFLAEEILIRQDIYKDFINLRRLSCPMADLLTVDSDNDEHKTSLVPGKLPESIEYLKPRCYDMVNTWISKDPSLQPYIEVFIRILEEAGPGQRLCNLKVLDLSYAFANDPDTDGIVTMKVLADDRGITLLLK
ncbi:hypothetical protein FCULG_00011760 [Fusarium culmorum]|uniref:F-box domain-containing protein n=1 Tax=Fusarium culmorum TaxID=5516 RepID=A0A2T4GRQ7_FUSCU|nr:hypothetical protein FCULG_00011760 [Fusarium culmorum]